MGALIEGSPPDLLAHLAGLLERAISPAQFWHWFVRSQAAIELYGTDEDFDLATLVELRFAEYTGGHVTVDELLDGLVADLEREYPHVLGPRRGAA